MAPRSASSFISASSPSSTFTICASCLRREFSTSQPAQKLTTGRRRFLAWVNTQGVKFQYPTQGSTNYLSAYDRNGQLVRSPGSKEGRGDLMPFPLNRDFVSEPILSESLRREIWRRVQVEGKSVRTVSVELGVEMRRVGAVVRLVELELKMRKEKKALALPYAQAIHEMVPTTPYNENQAPVPHEPINDLPVHSLTTPQIFYPTSESRAFTRTDAGRVFSAAPRLPDTLDAGQGGTPVEPHLDTRYETVGKGEKEIQVLKPADARIPHPHLIALAKDQANPEIDANEVKARYSQRLLDDATQRAEKRASRQAQEEKLRTRVESKRWEFIVTDISNSHNKKAHRPPGVRYGVPHEDRKKGQVKIPTKVEV